jgi:hypothetical protein
MKRLAALALACLCAAPPPAWATPAPPLIPPVDAAIERRFEEPATRFGPGHRGIDYAVPPGAPVRAAAAGTVAFAGRVADTTAVTLTHAGGLATTYTSLGDVLVAEGDSVDEGRWLGTAGTSHPGGRPGLHFGVRLNDAYVDPLDYLGALDPGGALHLAPVTATGAAPEPQCRPLPRVGGSPPAPNDNVAVAVGGISTRTSGGAVPPLSGRYLSGALGYPRARVHLFSYRGARGPRLHRPYDRADTYGDLTGAARGLRDLLVRIEDLHPGAGVDLVAHSQGGIVVRVLLEMLARSWDARLPRVEHVVTLASPHLGAPLAELPESVRAGPVGALGLEVVGALARRGWLPLPPPDAVAVAQLRPDSSLVTAVAREDVLYGTRVLSLAMPHDVVVPATRSRLAHEANRILAPEGAFGHSSILGSRDATAVAYGFLRDAPPACPGAWERWGRLLGAAAGGAQGALAWGARAVQSSAFPALLPGEAALRLARAALSR